MEQVTTPLRPEEETPAEAEAVAPWMPVIAPPDHCASCSVEKTDAPRCEHCGAAIRAGGHVILRTISQGPHGRVYEALAPDGKRVALKELIFSLVPDAATLDAFQREAELLRSVSHAQIPRLLTAFSEGAGVNTRLYLAQELVEGMSLQEAIAREKLSSVEARRLAGQVLRVLQALHGRDPPMLHRDVKPANLILRPDGVVSLVDFGSARLLARGVTHGATLVGTFGYMPPEQLGGTVDASCDLYALGATLMHALTGKPPEEMTRDGFSLDADRHLRDLADPQLRRVIKKMVAPNRADRYRSAEEALHALRGTRWSLPAAWKALPARPRRLLAALLGAAAFCGLLAYAAAPSTYLSRPSIPPRPRPPIVVYPSPSDGRQDPSGLGMLALSTSPAGLHVVIDRVPTGRFTPIPIAAPLYVRPGRHAVQFFLPDGRLSPDRVVSIEVGKVTTLRNVPVDPAR